MASFSRSSSCTALFFFAFIGTNQALAFDADAITPPADPGEAWEMRLAQYAPAPPPAAASETPPAEAAPERRKRPPRGYESDIDWAARRERYANMQETGFNLMMGGVACGVGGVALMVYGINRMEGSRDTDPYGNDTGNPDGLLPFMVGYISVALGLPALMTTGIILNRIGNHKRAYAEDMLGQGARLDIGPNSLKLSYSF